MADEAFAISPISARAVEPGEADYDAISAAFMETSRGRWFLGEYARRNRNADTRMVLDAVARIEENLAAQKQASDDRLPAALEAIRHAVDEARDAAAQAGARTEQSFAPIRSAAQTIREILMRLREIGADGRIYDLMDSQVSVIEAGCAEPALADVKSALNAAFDLIEQRISGFAGEGAVPAQASGASDLTTAGDETPSETAAAAPADDIAAPGEAAAPAEASQEEALLDMIALEMAAPDFAENDTVGSGASGLAPAEPVVIAQIPEPLPASQPASARERESSLGASLIASGIVRTSDPSAADPLAPIRRMSQAEKIAFFS